MEFALSKEQLLIQKSAREFAEKYVDPIAAEIDRSNQIPDSIIKGLAELDFLGLPYDEQYGGAGAGYLSYVLATEQLSRASGGVAMTMSVHTLGLGAIYYFATEEQKMKYLPDACSGKTLASFAFTEPQTGSDPKSITTTAVKDGDYYIINGTKRFISNANYAGPIVIFAKDETNGGISAFIVDKFCEGYSVSEPWEKIGLHGGILLDVYLKDIKVPAENLLGQPGKGYFILQTGISFGKVGMSCASLGGILAGYEEAVKYAKEKTHRDQPIAKFPTVQLHIAEIAMKYEAAKWLTYHLGYHADNIKDPVQFAKDAALTKTFVCESMVDVAREAMAVHGSYGLTADYKVERIWRDSIMGPQVEGVSDMQKMIIAGIVLAGK